MELDDRIIAVPIGENSKEFRGVVKMNETAAFIFNLLKEETTEDSVLEALAKEYKLPKESLIDDVKKCISVFEEKGLLI